MKAYLRAPLLCFLMLSGAALATALKPNAMLAARLPGIDLEKTVPTHFGKWTEVPFVSGQIVDPGRQQLIDTLYAETLTRTYVDGDGYLVMLSIAYGKDQRDALQLHRPEVCYPAQGFTMLDKQKSHLPGRPDFPITHMQTRLGERYEPVTYWTMVGNKPYAGSVDKKLIEIRYGLANLIPDGMLVRVSSIDRDSKVAFEKQQDFALAMISALSASVRPRFAGS